MKSDEIITIIDLMKLDTNIRIDKRDPSLQPLVPLDQGTLGISPILIDSSNLERNMMVLLSKHYKAEYDHTTNCLEEQMLSEIEHLFKNKIRFEYCTKKSLPKSLNLPDIDLAIYSVDENILLFVELKWTLEPAESIEVIDKTTIEQKGKEQIAKLLEFAKMNSRTVMGTCFPRTKFRDGVEYYGCVVIKGFCGSAKEWNRELPVIDESIMSEKIISINRLKDFITWLREQEFLPKEGKDFNKLDGTIKIGKNKIIWEKYELL
jgi:hypothetical protein